MTSESAFAILAAAIGWTLRASARAKRGRANDNMRANGSG
jgi:hypothetical protein